MRKAIKALLLFLFVLVILLFSILFSGIKINSFSFANLLISQFYIKLDKKLIVRINSIEFNSKKSNVESSIDDLKKNIDLLPKIISVFQEIDINSLKIDGNEFSIFINNEDIYLDNKYINLVSNISKASKQLEFDIKSLYLKDYDVLFEGLVKLDYFKNEIKYFGDIHYEGVVSKTNIDISKEKIKFFTRSEYFKNLHFLKKFLDLPSVANSWMYDNVKGDFKLDWFYGEFDLEKNEIIEKTLEGEAHIKDANITFHKSVENINTKSIKAKYKNNTLHFDLIDAKFINKTLKNSYVTLKNLTDEKAGIVDVYIESDTKLDSDILKILKAYSIDLPILQKSGNTKAKLLLSFPYDEKKSLSTNGEFLVENSEISISNFDFRSKNAKVRLENDMVFIENASFLLDKMIDATANISIDTKTLKSVGEVNINRLLIKESSNEILDLSNFSTPITMDFSKNVDIDLQNLDTKIRYEDRLFIVIEDLSKIYRHSKLLNDYSISKGNIVLEIIDEKNINFEAHLLALKSPLYKNNKKVEEFFLNGAIKNDNVNLSLNEESIKLDINDEINIFIKDYKIIDSFSSNKVNSDKNINISLENCSFEQEKDIYNLKTAKVFVKKDEINFEATINDFDFPLKKDSKKLDFLELKGSIKDNLTKLSSLDENLKIEKKNDSLKLEIKDFDIDLSLKNSNKLNYKSVLINGFNSNIIFNEEYKVLSENFIVNLDENEKFVYLKHKDSELSFREYDDGKIDMFAFNISEEFMNSLLNKEIINGGVLNFYANGSYDLLGGKLLIRDSSISNLSILSNLLAFVETTPAIATQLITIPFNPFFALPAAGIGLKNMGAYRLEEGNLSFSYDRDNNLLKIDNLNTLGSGIDFEGFGVLDLNNFTIDAKVNLIFLKDYTSFVRFIPLINYILLGEKERVETLIDIHGDLSEPQFSTNLIKDSFSAPFNIVKRVFTAPVNIFNGLNSSEDSKD